MTITIEPLSPALGARVTGIDLAAPIDAADFATLHASSEFG